MGKQQQDLFVLTAIAAAMTARSYAPSEEERGPKSTS